MRFWPAIRLAAVVTLLAVSAGLGLWEGVHLFGGGGTPGQQVARGAQLLYGTLAVLAVWGAKRHLSHSHRR